MIVPVSSEGEEAEPEDLSFISNPFLIGQIQSTHPPPPRLVTSRWPPQDEWDETSQETRERETPISWEM